MDFIPKKYLYRQHRYVAKDHPVQIQRINQVRYWKNFVSELDWDDSYDEYFMNWFCGFSDVAGFFKIFISSKLQEPRFFFVVYHPQRKLLRWLRFQFNFGEVYYSRRRRSHYLFVYRYKHLKILLDIFNGHLRFLKTIRQFYLWLQYYNHFGFFYLPFYLTKLHPNLLSNTHFMGVVDNRGNFKVFRSWNTNYKWCFRFRCVFYMDLPALEFLYLEQIKFLFTSPYYHVRSSSTVRVVINTFEDLRILIHIVMRFKPFNRILKYTFFNWKMFAEYMYLKEIKYRRRDRFVKLLNRYSHNKFDWIRKKRYQPFSEVVMFPQLLWPED